MTSDIFPSPSTDDDDIARAILAELRAIRKALEAAPAAATEHRPMPVLAVAVPSVTDVTAPQPAATDIGALLARRGITLLGSEVRSDADAPLAGLARRLMAEHEELRGFLRTLRWGASNGQRATYRIGDADARTVDAVTSVGRRLNDLGLLTRFHYRKENRCVEALVSEAGRAFLTGQWLERAAQIVAVQHLGATATVLRGAKVELPNGRTAELDVLAAYGEDVLWIECRTNNAAENAARYATLRRTLGLEPSAAIIVVGELDDRGLAEDLGALHQLTFVPPAGLAAAILVAAGAARAKPLDGATQPHDHDEAAPAVAHTPSPASEDRTPRQPAGDDEPARRTPAASDENVEAQLLGVLRDAGLHPRPAERPTVLSALLDARDDLLDGDRDSRELVRALAEQTAASRSAVTDVLRLLIRSCALLGADGTPVQSFGEPVLGLHGATVQVLDARCFETLRETVAGAAPWLLDGGDGPLSAAVGSVAEAP